MEPTRRKNLSPDTIREISSAEFFFASKRSGKSMQQRANCGKRRANDSDARTHRTPKALRAKCNHRYVLISSRHRGTFGVRARRRVALRGNTVPPISVTD